MTDTKIKVKTKICFLGDRCGGEPLPATDEYFDLKKIGKDKAGKGIYRLTAVCKECIGAKKRENKPFNPCLVVRIKDGEIILDRRKVVCSWIA